MIASERLRTGVTSSRMQCGQRRLQCCVRANPISIDRADAVRKGNDERGNGNPFPRPNEPGDQRWEWKARLTS